MIEKLKAIICELVCKKDPEINLPQKQQIQMSMLETEDPSWLKVARNELGIQEIRGRKHNARIIEYHQETSLKAMDDETSWCSSFIGWCFKESGIEGTNKANARSWLSWGRELKEPTAGCVVVLWRETKTSWKGHVAFYVGETDDHYLLLGGNQSNKVKVSKYPKYRLLGFRWPKTKPESQPS